MEFELTPPSAGVAVTLALLVLLFVALALLVGWIAWSTLRTPIAVADESLRLQLPFYGRAVPVASLKLSQARIVDLGTTPALRPRVRSNGIGLPGYSVGWFKLSNGEKALVALTSRTGVLYLPTDGDYVIVISPRDPEALLASLRTEADAR